MKILVVHNRYSSQVPSGENAMVDLEVELLASGGLDVRTFLKFSDEISDLPMREKLALPVRPVWSFDSARELREELTSFPADIVHVHNVFPLISPSVVSVARGSGAAVVQTMHNYRHSCVAGTHFRDGKACDDCIGRRFPYPAVLHGCYRSSRMQSIPMAVSQSAHRGTWSTIDRLIALTPFMASRAELAGIPRDRISIRPTWVVDPAHQVEKPGNHTLFVGRLDHSKGLDLLLEAWTTVDRPVGCELRIAGDGELMPLVLRAAERDPTIRPLGRLMQSQLRTEYQQAAVVVIPSHWYEGLPLVAVEAMAHGRPVIATSGGSIESWMTPATGWITPPDMKALAAAITAAIRDRQQLTSKGGAARSRYLREHSSEAALEQLLSIYEIAVRHRKGSENR